MNRSEEGKKSIIIIALITAISIMGNEMLFIVLPIYWKFFGLTDIWQIGILLSANRLIRLPINAIVGWCYQKMSKRTGIFLAVLLAIISTFSYGFLKGFWLLLIMRILWGIAWSFLRLGGYLTVISSSTKKNRGELIGLYNGLWGLGALAGMLIGGVFTNIVGIQFITTSFALLGVCSLPFILRYVPATKEATENPASKQDGKTVKRRKEFISIMCTGTIAAFVVFGIYTSTLSKVVESHFGIETTILNMTVAAVTISGVLQAIRMSVDPFVAPLVGKLSDQKFGRIPVLLFSLQIAIICLVLIPLQVSPFVFIPTVLVFQFIATILLTTSDALAADFSGESSSVKTMTYYTLFVDAGAALGPLLGYLVIDFIGLLWLYWLTAILVFGLLLYWYVEYFKKPKANV